MKKEMKYFKAAAVLIAAGLYLAFRSLVAGPPPKDIPQKGGFIYVERAVDGDTLKLANGKRVRLIGIDTPEVHYSTKLLKDAERSHKDIKTIQEMGQRASDFTKRLVEERKVRLEFDIEKRDRYGRLLAYAYLEDGTFVNAKIVEEGYAQVMTIPPNVKYADRFLKMEREARENSRGLWGDESLKWKR